ncbi:hypothetical protein [Flavobacterium columnare]|uniref:Phage tail protein n=1 Tax=Flavobacterium columnare TaxID=996 RepID=A0AAI8CEJ3_9FLAO|nr:hypothetical protein [Flavobacterium columnare]AMO19225.1 hypothetical protein UN65_01615 [Flavobacterium columnare]AUX17158.1 hypothetical protein AQ623_01670 [Flavobacterium columnare]QOG56176.1 hypothetical protein HUE29_01630 [Flavobacterium columnare]QOG58899.1 hypothetical protein HUE30_01630 [Flavobacterium columnare]QOG61621.1 hypothetical protein HUE31_01635 [Flavobacterium columnare]
MADITRNGKAYDSVDCEAFINGVSLEITSATYGNEQEHQLNWTMGQKPTSWSSGKRTPSCSIGIMMHDIVPIELASNGGSILDIKPFWMIFTFTNEFNVIVTDKVLVKFQNEGREVTGEMGLKKEYTMFALDVKLNVAA